MAQKISNSIQDKRFCKAEMQFVGKWAVHMVSALGMESWEYQCRLELSGKRRHLNCLIFG